MFSTFQFAEHCLAWDMTQASSWEARCSPPMLYSWGNEDSESWRRARVTLRAASSAGLTPSLGLFPRLLVTAWLWGAPAGRLRGESSQGRRRTWGRAGMGRYIRARLTLCWVVPLTSASTAVPSDPPNPFLSLDVHGPLPQTRGPCLLTHL